MTNDAAGPAGTAAGGHSQPGADGSGQDPAVEFLRALAPSDDLSRKRVFNALLRATLAQGEVASR